MKKIREIKILFIFISIFWFSFSFSQTHNAFYQSVVDSVSYDTILHHLQTFQSLGVKEVGTTELVDAKNWLVNKYISFGYTNVQVDSFNHSGDELYNVIVNKTGTLYPDSFVLVTAHYDTKNGTGTNDNGSGTAILLEIARLIKDIPTKYSVSIIHFTGEEAGYLGSENYLANYSTKIRIVFNIDEVGGVAGISNDTISCESDQSFPPGNDAASQAFTDTLMTLTGLYSSLHPINTNAYGSDYVPFQYADYTITGYYETNHSSFVHSANDLLVNLDTSYVWEICKGATAATLYYAKAFQNPIACEELSNEFLINIFPNPFSNCLHVNIPNNISACNFELFDLTGRLILKVNDVQKRPVINISESISSGCYLYKISSDQNGIIKSGILFKSFAKN